MSPVIINDRYTTNNIYPHYPNYINPINCINNQNLQYPNYFTNYNTSNNYHINASQQNIFYGKENQKYSYPVNNAQNNYNMDNISRSVNRKLINEAKEKLRSVSNENVIKQKKKKNFEKLNIINCETQYPLMTCLNADPYNRLKRKSFIQNFNNINNYIINSNTKNNNEVNENSEHKMSTIQSESLFNNRYLKNKTKYNGFNNSCYNFRAKDNSNTKTINNSLTKINDIIYENDNIYINNQLKRSKLKESILKMDYNYEENLSKINKYTNINYKLNNIKSIDGDRRDFIIKMKKFIGYIEQYFIKSFQKLFHDFLSQMMIYIKEKIYENKNLLLKRFQRARNARVTYNSSKNNSPENSHKLEGSHNDINKIYIPKKQQYKYIKPIKRKSHNINIITNNSNLNTNTNSNTVTYIKTDYNLKAIEKPFQKRVIDKDNNSVDRLRYTTGKFNNKNKSQDNFFSQNNYSPIIPVYSKSKYILKTNSKNNEANKNRIIYTKKRTNKFNVNKKYITEELLKDNNNNKNNINNQFSFINIHGTKSPTNMKYKANERYEKEYNDIDNEEIDDTIEQTIIKDICTYDKKFSVFIKYVTSRKYEQNYLRLKLLKYKNLYLNHKLNYFGRTHTDSITLKACYRNLKIMMNEISEEKESFNLSNIQDDENSMNKLINMVNIIELFSKKIIYYFYHIFFNLLKYISISNNSKNIEGRNDRLNKNINTSRTFFKLKKKEILIDNDINYKKKLVNVDLLNNLFKRCNSVKANNKEFKINDNLELKDKLEQKEKFENIILQLKINLLKFAFSKGGLEKEDYSNNKNEQNNIINTN